MKRSNWEEAPQSILKQRQTINNPQLYFDYINIKSNKYFVRPTWISLFNLVVEYFKLLHYKGGLYINAWRTFFHTIFPANHAFQYSPTLYRMYTRMLDTIWVIPNIAEKKNLGHRNHMEYMWWTYQSVWNQLWNGA